MNSSGKVLTIFVVIIAILLITLTAISLFFFQKETERRKVVEATLEEIRAEKVKLEANLKEAKQENFRLQEKNKEFDDRVNDLSDELELEKGLREEMKIDAAALKEQIEEIRASKEELTEEIKAKEEVQKKLMADLDASEQKIKELEARLEAEAERTQKLGELYEQKQEKVSELEKESFYEVVPDETDLPLEEDASGQTTGLGVELGEIVVTAGETIDEEETFDIKDDAPAQKPVIVLDRDSEGRVLSVDVETEFVIVSLGEMDGIEIGDVLSVYRDKDYIGDLRITRLQPEMSAADLIPPFSIGNVKKDDQVKAK